MQKAKRFKSSLSSKDVWGSYWEKVDFEGKNQGHLREQGEKQQVMNTLQNTAAPNESDKEGFELPEGQT